MSSPNLLCVKDAAKLLNVSDQYVRALLRDGKIPGKQLGKTWAIDRSSIEDYINKLEIINPSNHVRQSTLIPPIKALSFFSGAMGLDLGLEATGIHVLLACEIDKACRQTIKANRPDLALLGNIWDYSAEDIRAAAGLSQSDDIDVIAGGPPCQAFSTAGTRQGFKDDRGNALLRYVNLALELRPKYIVIENVRGLLSAPLSHRAHADRGNNKSSLTPEELPGGALAHVLNSVSEGGYTYSFNLYNSANFGVPQVRERVIIICSRNGIPVPHLMPTHSNMPQFGLPQWPTLKDAFFNLKSLDDEFVNFPEERLKFYRMLKAGQYWKHLPLDAQKLAMGKSYFSGGGKTGFYRRLAWDKPSCTLVTYPAMPATDICHPDLDRPLSVAEYKRIQQFPDSWLLCGSVKDKYKQIGNAVPVGLGHAVGKAIINHINGVCETPLRNFPYSRYKHTDESSWQANLATEVKELILKLPPLQMELLAKRRA